MQLCASEYPLVVRAPTTLRLARCACRWGAPATVEGASIAAAADGSAPPATAPADAAAEPVAEAPRKRRSRWETKEELPSQALVTSSTGVPSEIVLAGGIKVPKYTAAFSLAPSFSPHLTMQGQARCRDGPVLFACAECICNARCLLQPVAAIAYTLVTPGPCAV